MKDTDTYQSYAPQTEETAYAVSDHIAEALLDEGPDEHINLKSIVEKDSTTEQTIEEELLSTHPKAE